MTRELVAVEWEGRPIEALVPAPLLAIGPLGRDAERDAARAEGVLAAGIPQHDQRLEVAARLFLRAEAVASSRSGAITAPAELVAVADVDPLVAGPATEVADNLRALDAALARDAPLTFDVLWDWHRILMTSAEVDPQFKGAWR